MTRKNRGKKPRRLLLCLDAGTSLMKVLYQVGIEPVKYLSMSAEVLQLPNSSIPSLPKSSDFGKLEDNSWIQLHSDSDCYLVGRLAQQYRATTSIKKLKYELIIPKILAVVGVIAHSEQMADNIELDFALLLPFSENNNSQDIESELKTAIQQFWFRGQLLNVKLNDCCYYPEGYGLAMSRVSHFGREQFQSQNLAYLMFGYRNTSLLLFRNGTLSRHESKTTQLGFYDLIDKICSKVSGISRDEVQASIRTREDSYYNVVTARYEPQIITKFEIDDLVKSSDSVKAYNERQQLKSAIEVANTEYSQLIENWLNEVLPPSSQLDEIIYCGGTSEFIKKQLKEYCKHHQKSVKLSSSATEENELLKALDLDEYKQKEFRQQNLALRFADVWGLFVKFSSYQINTNQETVSQSNHVA